MLLRSASRKPGMSAMAVNSRRTDDEDVEIGERSHGGVARPGVHGGEFPEEVAGAEGIDPTALLGDRHGPRENEEELATDPPLPGQHLAPTDLDPFGQAGHLLELGPGALTQLIDRFQPVDGRLPSEGGHHCVTTFF